MRPGRVTSGPYNLPARPLSEFLRKAAEKAAPWPELRREDTDARSVSDLVDVVEEIDDIEVRLGGPRPEFPGS